MSERKLPSLWHGKTIYESFYKTLNTFSKQSSKNYVNTGFFSAKSPRTVGAFIFYRNYEV